MSADLIRFNGHIVANDTFVVDRDGNLTLNDITANNLTLSGDINGNDATLNNITLNNVTANSGVFKGEFSTSMSGGSRVTIKEENEYGTDGTYGSIRVYDNNNDKVIDIGFKDGNENSPYISITSGHGSTLSILSISTNRISIMNSTGVGESDEVWLDTMYGLRFFENGILKKSYPAR